MAAELVVPERPFHQRIGPASEGVDDLAQSLSPFGERVGVVVGALDHAGVFEGAKSVCKEIRGDPG